MSIKDLFRNRKVLGNTSVSTAGNEVESKEYVAAHIENEKRFVPNIDFSIPDNFARYGSAELYYDDAIKRIYNDYPFDGSEKEKIEFFNSGSYLDKFIFENEYPRTTGHVRFSRTGWGTQANESGNRFGQSGTDEYITIKGGPHTGSGGTYVGGNVFDTSKRRGSNLRFGGDEGNTIEFFLNKGNVVAAKTEKEVVFDLWNNETVATGSGSQYGRLTVYLSGTAAPNTALYFTYMSGTTVACLDQALGPNDGTCDVSSLFNDAWHHYAITAYNNSTDLVLKFHLDGNHKQTTVVVGGAINEVTGALIANIGALRTKYVPDESPVAAEGYGKLSGSLDEFRFWKTARTGEEIGRNWFRQVAGGTNTDDANVKLGVYYKFNEGITTTASVDRQVLDYSGRLSNGLWTGYATSARSLDSAMIESSASAIEFKDPIIYPAHAQVSQYITNKRLTGSYYDVRNNASIYYTMPGWMIDEDQDKGNKTLLKLTQIIASYFDSLHMQIEALPTLKNAEYVSSSDKPYPFSDKLLSGVGFVTPEIFEETKTLSYLGGRDDYREFQSKLSDVKNLIYQNIYNNISFIYKSKGTEKSFRNLIRCFGVDDELVNVNLYGDNIEHKFEDSNFKSVSIRKNVIDFNNVDRFAGTIYQYTASGNSNTISYLSASSPGYEKTGYAKTYECQLVFPKKHSTRSDLYFETAFKTASLFGIHTIANATDFDETTWPPADPANFQVYAVRDKLESSKAYFKLTGSSGGYVPNLTSSIFKDVYDNSIWNLAVRIKPTKYPQVAEMSGTVGTYNVEFCGYNTFLDNVVNEFSVSGTMTATQGTEFITSSARFYAGSHKTNFTGSFLKRTDVKIASARIWLDYLSDDEIKEHAKDVESYGVTNPYNRAYAFQFHGAANTGSFIPRINTLAMHWNFGSVTGSDASGQFKVDDISSGSAILQSKYGWLGRIINAQHSARGDGFPASDIQVVDTEYLISAQKTLPEIINGDDMVSILERDDEIFTRDTRPTKYFISVEKSPYQAISKRMMNIFSTIKDFNNLIGEPVNRYRADYKDLDKLRSLFFDKIDDVENVEKFIDYYIWIDDALGKMVQQLVPASANVADEIVNVIESHVLERNKYWTKFPTLESKFSDPTGSLRGINELKYNWEFGHHPISNNQSDNCFHWRMKELRSDATLTTGDTDLDNDKNKILSASLSTLNRKLNSPLDFAVVKNDSVDVTGRREKKIDGFNVKAVTDFNRISDSYIKVFAADDVGVIPRKDCNDDVILKKTKLEVWAENNKEKGGDDYNAGEGDILLPFDIYSSSIVGGYASALGDDFKESVSIEHLHEDSYGFGNERPMQGPYTEKHVGGAQYRHQPLNTGSTLHTAVDRAEGFKVIASGQEIRVVGPEASSQTTTDINYLRAPYLREEGAKRPVSIKNIVKENFREVHEVVNTSARHINNSDFAYSGGYKPAPILSDAINGISEFAKPRRLKKSKHVFVERFSSPGDPQTAGDDLGGPGLNVESGEFSVYNNINYRNRLVRIPMDTLSSRCCGRFGVDSEVGLGVLSTTYYDLVSASFHKIQRNTLKRIFNTGSISGSYYTKSIDDNWFVQHQIPRHDTNYAWISASYSGGPIGSFATSSDQLQLITASDVGHGFNGGTSYYDVSAFEISQGGSGSSFLPDSFVWLNYHLYENLTASTRTLGPPLNINWDNIDNGVYNKNIVGDFWSSGYLSQPNRFTYLNTLLNKRNGPYQYPSWKQLRTGEHPLARAQVKANEIHVIEPAEEIERRTAGNRRVLIRAQRGRDIGYTEPPISKRHLPIRHLLLINGDGQDSSILMDHSYGNNLTSFANPELANRLGASISQKQVLDKLTKLYIDEAAEPQNPIKDFDSLLYSERLWPKETNVFLERTRNRTQYSVDYWRDTRTGRNWTASTSSQGFAISQASRWFLDARDSFTTAAPQTGGLGYHGELQNNYTTFFRTDFAGGNPTIDFAQNLRIGALYNRPVWQYTSGKPYEGDVTSSGRIIAGDTKWTAATEAGKRPFYATYNEFSNDLMRRGKEYSIIPEFRISEHMSFYIDDHGGNFLKDKESFLTITGTVRNDSGTASFFKEYAHSDFMKHFDLINSKHQEIGATSEITLRCKALKKFIPYDGFYPAHRTLQLATLFSQSYGDHVAEAGYTSSVVNTNKSKWRSFMAPFFGPGILYNSIKAGAATDFPIYTEKAPSTREDILAGGSGSLGVTSEWTTALSSPFTRRVEFEGLVEPENYLARAKIWDMEPDVTASMRLYHAGALPGGIESFSGSNQASYWSSRGSEKYKMAMHNFLAEVPGFFLKNEKLTTFASKPIPKEGITITAQQANDYYAMDVYVSNGQCRNYTEWSNRQQLPEYSASVQPTGTATTATPLSAAKMEQIKGTHTQMYSRDSAFGPPWVSDHKTFTSVNDLNSHHYSYEPFTPAFQNGFGLIRLKFFPFKGAGNYTLDEIQSNTEASFIRMPTTRTGSNAVVNVNTMLEWQTAPSLDVNLLKSASVDSTTTNSSSYYYAASMHSASNNWQQLSSSINFLAKTKTKKVTYELGADNQYNPVRIEDSLDDTSESWIIQPKWETPVLNFFNKTPTAPAVGYGTASVAKGMWHQHGAFPAGDEGLWFGISDLPDGKITASYASDLGGDRFGYMDNKTEDVIERERENASVTFYMRNPNASLWLSLNGATIGPPSGTPPGGMSSQVDRYSASFSSLETCDSIANIINGDTAMRVRYTASAFPVPVKDNPFYATGAILNDGTYFVNCGVAGVEIKLKNVTTATQKHPDYYASGELGNQLVALVTGNFDSGPIVAAEPEDGESPAYYSIDRAATMRGTDLTTGKETVATHVKFRGGETNKFKVKSMADLLGFSKTQQRLGEVAEKKIVSEAIVAVPFIEKGNKKQFFGVPRYQVDVALGQRKTRKGQIEPGKSIVDMVQRMNKYVFPPKMDFVTNKEVKPFAMYIFEFEHEFSREDLSDIWQNLAPESVDKIEEQTSTINHKFLKNEIFGGKLDSNVRWMVFKVKQRAEKNYFAKTTDSRDDDRFKFNFSSGKDGGSKDSVPKYSYNWPYDYCSIVEMARFETEVEIKNKKFLDLDDDFKDEIKVGKTKATQAETRDSLVGRAPIKKIGK